jgi:hypothetical protein
VKKFPMTDNLHQAMKIPYEAIKNCPNYVLCETNTFQHAIIDNYICQTDIVILQMNRKKH